MDLIKDYALKVWNDELKRFVWVGVVIEAFDFEEAIRLARELVLHDTVYTVTGFVSEYGGVRVSGAF